MSLVRQLSEDVNMAQLKSRRRMFRRIRSLPRRVGSTNSAATQQRYKGHPIQAIVLAVLYVLLFAAIAFFCS